MNILDLIFGILLGYFCIRGFFRGIIRELASIGGLVLGFYLANTYYAPVAPLLNPLLDNPGIASVVAYVLVLVLTMLVVGLVAAGLRRLLNIRMFSVADYALGGVFGFAKGGLFSAIVLMLCVIFVPRAGFVAGSQLRPYFLDVSIWISQYLPEQMRDSFEIGLDKLPPPERDQEPAP